MSQTLISLKIENTPEHTGRFIGFIKDDEFNALIDKSKEVGTRLESKATQPLYDVLSKFDDLSGLRLVMVVKKEGSKEENGKVLFVTDRLSMITEVKPQREATILTENSNTILVKEI